MEIVISFLVAGIIAYADHEINMLRPCKSVIFPPFVTKLSQNHIFKASHTSRNALKSTLSRLHGINTLLSFLKSITAKNPLPEERLFLTGDLLPVFYYTAAITSTSQRTFFGSVLTATQERAGLFTKYFAYTSLNAAKSFISARKHTVLTAFS